MACIDDWCCQNITNITDYNITVGSQPIGQYFFNISVSNDVSIVFKEHNVSVEGKKFGKERVWLPGIGAFIHVIPNSR